MNVERDEALADLITALALNPTTARPSWVTPSEWVRVGELATIESRLRAAAAAVPPLDQDPTAAMLGLLPDPESQLDGGALKRARKSSRLSIADLARRLTDRGWQVTQTEVFRWENNGAPDVPPAQIEAIGVVLGCDPATLTKPRHSDTANDVSLAGPVYQGLVRRLADALGISAVSASARLHSAALGAVHRGDRPVDDALEATLEGYVRAMEKRHGES